MINIAGLRQSRASSLLQLPTCLKLTTLTRQGLIQVTISQILWIPVGEFGPGEAVVDPQTVSVKIGRQALIPTGKTAIPAYQTILGFSASHLGP